jgi:hypothetical protein
VKANQEAMGVDPEEMKSVMEHQGVPKEGAAVEMIGALKERYRDWHLSIGHRQQPKKRAQGDGGSWKKLAAACRQMTHHAIPASRRGHGRRCSSRVSVAREARKGSTLKRRQRMPQ